MRTSRSCSRRAARLVCAIAASLLLGGCGGVQRRMGDGPAALTERLTERKIYQQARLYFAQRRYREAADLLELLHDQHPLAGLLQNLGAAYLRLARQTDQEPMLRLAYAVRACSRLSRLRVLGQADAADREQLESARGLIVQLGQKLGWSPPESAVPAACEPTLPSQIELSATARSR